MKSILLIAICCWCILLTVYGACPYDNYDQLYSSNNAWIQPGASVIIPSGKRVVLDVTTPILNSLIVQGELIVKDVKDLELNTRWLKVMSGGKLIIGDESCPIKQKVYVTLHGNRTLTSDMGNEPTDNGALGK
jgi:hypothetical protein